MRFLESVLSYVFPPVCGICGKLDYESLCKDCKKQIQEIEHCNIQRILDKNLSYHCYLFTYEDIIRRKMIAYKFEGKSYLCETFVKIVLDHKKACDFLRGYDIIMPVPIDLKRRKRRGYNQTELIARKVAKSLAIKYEDTNLKKIKKNKPQSTLTKEERKENVKNVYQIKNKDTIKNKTVVLFDDVYTTGNTAKECARILKQAGVKQVGIITIAKD